MRAACLSLIALATAGIAHADVRLNFAANGKGSQMSRFEVTNGRMRTDTPDASVVVDVEHNEMITIDHDRKQFTRIDGAQMERMAGAVSGAMAQAQAALANLPPEQRAMIEERMGGHMPGAAKINVRMTATGKHEKVAGYDCEMFSTFVDDEHQSDICLASAEAVGLSASDRQTLQGAFSYFKRMAEKMSAGLGNMSLPFDKIGADRVPVKMVEYGSGKAGTVTTLASVDKGALPASDFAPPAGYREHPLDIPNIGR